MQPAVIVTTETACGEKLLLVISSIYLVQTEEAAIPLADNGDLGFEIGHELELLHVLRRHLILWCDQFSARWWKSQSFTRLVMRDYVKDQVPCWLTYTNAESHEIIQITCIVLLCFQVSLRVWDPLLVRQSWGWVVRFADKGTPPAFLRTWGPYRRSLCAGLSTSLPEDAEVTWFIRKCWMMRTGCIEYDMIMLSPGNLQTKKISLSYSRAIQWNPGYEEAAGQGIIVGQCALKIQGKPELVLKRSDGYIEPRIDDLRLATASGRTKRTKTRCAQLSR